MPLTSTGPAQQIAGVIKLLRVGHLHKIGAAVREPGMSASTSAMPRRSSAGFAGDVPARGPRAGRPCTSGGAGDGALVRALELVAGAGPGGGSAGFGDAGGQHVGADAVFEPVIDRRAPRPLQSFTMTTKNEHTRQGLVVTVPGLRSLSGELTRRRRHSRIGRRTWAGARWVCRGVVASAAVTRAGSEDVRAHEVIRSLQASRVAAWFGGSLAGTAGFDGATADLPDESCGLRDWPSLREAALTAACCSKRECLLPDQ